ncbi:MAG: Gfo/Idh/MocA family oxidoreductase [Phycisphaerales bacterium]|nr:Gfo/Idh/MocA family oxidoreductase [Phycisphaerales bacterium]
MKLLDELRVVLVGCGGMANAWVQNTLALAGQNVRLVGLVDIRREAAIAKAQKYQLPETLVFNSLREAVKATDANVVFDVTIPQAHEQVTLEALSLGCHVLGEKPMSETMDKARRMVAAARDADRLYAVTQTRRPDASVLAVVDFLATGKLGPVEEIHSDFYIGAHFGGFRDEMDEVLLVDMAIHTFDNARQIGCCDPVSVYCHSWNPPHSWYKGNASALAILK